MIGHVFAHRLKGSEATRQSEDRTDTSHRQSTVEQAVHASVLKVDSSSCFLPRAV